MEQLIQYERPADSAFNRFLHSQTAGGIVLIITSLIAFLLANSSLWEEYDHFSHIHFSLNMPKWHLDLGLAHWVNDGLMVIFFFVVGLEIKREILVGELSTPKKASLAVFGALGGMIVPATIYAIINARSPNTLGGWGIPMATDIAFAIGILSLLGRRVPITLKVFLTALAIVDDLGAIIVIALFYTEQFAAGALGMSLLVAFASWLYGRFGGTRGGVFALLTIACWYFILQSGIHATISGVLMALTIPIRQKYDIHDINRHLGHNFRDETFELKEEHLEALERVVRNAESPLHRFERKLHPWVVFMIMPIFAFFNAGVHMPEDGGLSLIGEPHVLGIIFGLVLGKPIGVIGACWISVRLGIAALPDRVDWKAMIGVGCLAGLGFTMSLFIAVLGFDRESAYLPEAKLAILCSSIFATCLGSFLLWKFLPEPPPLSPTQSPSPHA